MSGSGRPPEEETGNPPHYSCLGNPTDREAWRAIVHGVAKSQAQLSNKTTTNTLNPISGSCYKYKGRK